VIFAEPIPISSGVIQFRLFRHSVGLDRPVSRSLFKDKYKKKTWTNIDAPRGIRTLDSSAEVIQDPNALNRAATANGIIIIIVIIVPHFFFFSCITFSFLIVFYFVSFCF
jgi:hypothetical protein